MPTHHLNYTAVQGAIVTVMPTLSHACVFPSALLTITLQRVCVERFALATRTRQGAARRSRHVREERVKETKPTDNRRRQKKRDIRENVSRRGRRQTRRARENNDYISNHDHDEMYRVTTVKKVRPGAVASDEATMRSSTAGGPGQPRYVCVCVCVCSFWCVCEYLVECICVCVFCWLLPWDIRFVSEVRGRVLMHQLPCILPHKTMILTATVMLILTIIMTNTTP